MMMKKLIFLLTFTLGFLRLPSVGAADTALVLIDFQRGVTEAQGPYSIGPSRSAQLIHNALTHLQAAQEQGLPVIFVVTQWPKWRLLENWWFRNTFRVGNPWADLDPRFGKPETLLIKSHADAFTNPALGKLLRQWGVRKLVLAGLFADACVRATTKTALEKGYPVSILADAVVTRKVEDFPAALATLKQLGAVILQ